VQEKATFRGSFNPVKAPVARKVVPRAAVCSAESKDAPKVGQILAAAALAAAVSFGSVEAAHADISGLTPCSESKGFAKREKNELKALNKRLKQVSDHGMAY
jgi:photosystem I subunit III